MPRKCSAPGCKSLHSPGTRLHKVPKEVEHARTWIINSGREDLLFKSAEHWQKSVFFCQKHFQEETFNNPNDRRTIKKYAVPSLFEHGGPVFDITIPGDSYPKPVLDPEDLFNLEQPMVAKMAHKLSPDHISPPAFGGRMRVKHAVQVYSRSVGKAIRYYVASKDLPEDHLAFAEAAEKFDMIFDILNSSRKHEKNMIKSALCEETPETFQKIEDLISWLHTLEIWQMGKDGQEKNTTKKHRFIDGMKMALRAAQMIFADLKKRGLITILRTRYLGTDCLENVFAELRARCGSNKHPAPFQMEYLFRQLAFH